MGNEKKIIRTDTGKVGRPRRIYNLQLASEITYQCEYTDDEKNEIRRIFSNEQDMAVGEQIYKLRKMGKNKAEICHILSVERRTIDRLYGTIKYSKFLNLLLQEQLYDTALAEPAAQDFEVAKHVRLIKVKDRLNQILNGVTPDKIFDADLDTLGHAYTEFLKGMRLEQGQSTENKAYAFFPGDKQAEAESRGKLNELTSKLDSALAELKVLNATPGTEEGGTAKDSPGTPETDRGGEGEESRP